MTNTRIQTVAITTANGNTLQLFYNGDTGLVVVDLIASNDNGGNEILRKTIDEKAMLAHTVRKGKRKSS